MALNVVRLAIVVVVVAAWYAAAKWQVVPAGIAGSPGATWSYIWHSLQQLSFWVNFWATLEATLIAFVVGSVAGIALGILLGMNATLERILSPFVSALNSLPRVALAPLFIIYFGLAISSKIAMGFSLVVFILLENTMAGIKSVDADIIQLFHALGANRSQLFRKVIFQTATPAIFAGLRLGMIYAFLGVVTSEILGSKDGLGALVSLYSNTFSMDNVYGILIVLAVVAAVLNYVMTMLERWLLRWQPPVQHQAIR